ncbi:MAG: hypothetical protein HYY17_06695 [Planctomycetes bacterium]|nr:hypothetical protein [Planctomycetota bacterium]
MKRKFRLYLDTSVWVRLADRARWVERRATYHFLNRSCQGHEVLISPLVAVEVNRTPDPEERRTILRQIAKDRREEITGRAWAQRFAGLLTEVGGFGPRMLADLTHVGYAVLGNADAIVTWDRRTLARDKVRRTVHAVCRREGLEVPLIGRPEEIVEWLGLRI